MHFSIPTNNNTFQNHFIFPLISLHLFLSIIFIFPFLFYAFPILKALFKPNLIKFIYTTLSFHKSKPTNHFLIT